MRFVYEGKGSDGGSSTPFIVPNVANLLNQVNALVGDRRLVFKGIHSGPSFLSAQLMKSSTSALNWFKWFVTFRTINGVLEPPSLPPPP